MEMKAERGYVKMKIASLFVIALLLIGGIAAVSASADLNRDGQVNEEDRKQLLADWGRCEDCASDLNSDGIVNGQDLAQLLAGWTNRVARLSDTEASVSVRDVASESVFESAEIEEALREAAEERDEYRRLGFSKMTRGFGSMDNGDEGYLVNGFWIVQEFAIQDSNGEIVREDSRAHGTLRINGVPQNYRLTKMDISEREANFALVVRERTEDRSEANVRQVGELHLELFEELDGLSKWEGTLELEDGDLRGEWDVELSTTTKTVRLGSDRAVDSDSDSDRARANAGDEARARIAEGVERNPGFFGRLRAFFSRG